VENESKLIGFQTLALSQFDLLFISSLKNILLPFGYNKNL